MQKRELHKVFLLRSRATWDEVGLHPCRKENGSLRMGAP